MNTRRKKKAVAKLARLIRTGQLPARITRREWAYLAHKWMPAMGRLIVRLWRAFIESVATLAKQLRAVSEREHAPAAQTAFGRVTRSRSEDDVRLVGGPP